MLNPAERKVLRAREEAFDLPEKALREMLRRAE